MSDSAVYLQTLLIAMQVFLLFGQLKLSNKINQQFLSTRKGYFLIKETNCGAPKEHISRYQDQFDLSKHLPFYVVGNDDIIIIDSEIKVNGIIHQSFGIPSNTYFSINERSKETALIDLELKNHDYQKDEIDVVITLKLKNTVNFKYTEIITLTFNKEKDHDWWLLNKRNISFS